MSDSVAQETQSGDRVAEAIGLGAGESLERAYVFDPVERGGVAFLLALVTKRRVDGRLEMAALGGHAGPPGAFALDFASRVRIPDDVLPWILGELIDRCEAGGAVYREIDLGLDASIPPDEQVASLVERLLPPGGAT